MFKAWCQCAKSCLSVREVLKPNGQLERAGATGAGQGRAAEGKAGVVSQSYKQWVQWNTEVEGVGGLRTTVGRSRALPHPIGARRTESEAGVGAGGARRSNTVAFRGLDRWFAKVLHKLGSLQQDKITRNCI